MEKATGEVWRELANKQEKKKTPAVITELFSTKPLATDGSFQLFFVFPASATDLNWREGMLGQAEIPKKAPGLLLSKKNKIFYRYV